MAGVRVTEGSLQLCKIYWNKIVTLAVTCFFRVVTYSAPLKVVHDVTRSCRGDGVRIQV